MDHTPRLHMDQLLSPRSRSLYKSPTATHASIEPLYTNTAEDVAHIINDTERKNFQLGIVLLAVAVGTWIIGLELVNSVLKGDEYRKPCLFAWITGSCFALNFVPDLVRMAANWRLSPPPVHETTSLLSKDSEKPPGDKAVELSLRQVALLAAQVSIIYMLYNMFVMLALQFTSASNQTVLGSTTSIFTLFIGAALRIDKITIKKVVCIFISMAGVFLINWSETRTDSGADGGLKFTPRNPLLGNMLAIGGALMYALYLILMKVQCGTGNRTTNERRLFGWVGVYTFFLGIPVVFAAHYLGVEPFEFPPPSNRILVLVVVNGVFSIVSDYATILAMLLTSPLVTSLSLTSAIPITIFIDFLVSHMTSSDKGGPRESHVVYFLGIVSILVLVVLINVNLTSENELIDELIDDALEEALRDEALSPVLSPLVLLPRPGPTGVDFKTVIESFSPRVKLAAVTPGISHFELPLSQIEGFQSIDSNEPEGTIMVYGGLNHQYHIKAVDVPPLQNV
jgi:solute carrier family 35 protein F5